jgi:Bacteriophage baseplate protein W
MGRGCDARFGQRTTGVDANERRDLRADRHAVERHRHTNTSHRHMNVDFPYHFDPRGRTAEIDYDAHIRDLIEQVLFTAPGERVNRPDFGSGLLRLVFAPNSNELAATTQYLVQGSLQQYLGDLIQVDAVDVISEDSTLRVSVRYLVRRTQTLQTAEFTKGVPTA